MTAPAKRLPWADLPRCPMLNKIQHPDRASANAHREQINRDHRRGASGQATIFRCDWCWTLHVGSRHTSARGRKR